MTSFTPTDRSAVKRLVDAYPLCWVVSGDQSERYASPLPLLAELNAAGDVTSLLGHMARANPQQQALERSGAATILCMGPQGYVSPRLVSNPVWGPTWNYAVCRFETQIRFLPHENDAALHQLAAALEGAEDDAWTPGRMGTRYDELKQRIVAFRAEVLETHARFKLGQDENDGTFDEIVTNMADRTLADWMKRTRG